MRQKNFDPVFDQGRKGIQVHIVVLMELYAGVRQKLNLIIYHFRLAAPHANSCIPWRAGCVGYSTPIICRQKQDFTEGYQRITVHVKLQAPTSPPN